MVYVIFIIANYFLNLKYQTMRCNKQTHFKGFLYINDLCIKTLSFHFVNTYPGSIFFLLKDWLVFFATNGRFNLDELTLTHL